jgi:hypothetical protein
MAAQMHSLVVTFGEKYAHGPAIRLRVKGTADIGKATIVLRARKDVLWDTLQKAASPNNNGNYLDDNNSSSNNQQ